MGSLRQGLGRYFARFVGPHNNGEITRAKKNKGSQKKKERNYSFPPIPSRWLRCKMALGKRARHRHPFGLQYFPRRISALTLLLSWFRDLMSPSRKSAVCPNVGWSEFPKENFTNLRACRVFSPATGLVLLALFFILCLFFSLQRTANSKVHKLNTKAPLREFGGWVGGEAR